MLAENKLSKICVYLTLFCFISTNVLFAANPAELTLNKGITSFNVDFDMEEAEQKFREVIRMKDEDEASKKFKMRAHFWLAKVLVTTDKENGARETFRDMFKKYPEPFGDYRQYVKSKSIDKELIVKDKKLNRIYEQEREKWLKRVKETFLDMNRQLEQQKMELSILKKRKSTYSILGMLMSVILVGAYASSK